ASGAGAACAAATTARPRGPPGRRRDAAEPVLPRPPERRAPVARRHVEAGQRGPARLEPLGARARAGLGPAGHRPRAVARGGPAGEAAARRALLVLGRRHLEQLPGPLLRPLRPALAHLRDQSAPLPPRRPRERRPD